MITTYIIIYYKICILLRGTTTKTCSTNEKYAIFRCEMKFDNVKYTKLHRGSPATRQADPIHQPKRVSRPLACHSGHVGKRPPLLSLRARCSSYVLVIKTAKTNLFDDSLIGIGKIIRLVFCLQPVFLHFFSFLPSYPFFLYYLKTV